MDDASRATPQERADPIDEVIVPESTGQAMGQSRAEQAGIAINGTHPDKDQREGADHFGEALLDEMGLHSVTRFRVVRWEGARARV